jgi:polysaccharide export outer membrane protein
VWKEPELSTTVAVRTDGMISILLLNDVPAVGLTPIELAAILREKLKKFVEDPRITVVVSQMTPQRIYIVGEVAHQGPMSLLPDMTVFQALATAGLNQFANAKKIYVMRNVDSEQRKFLVNYKQLLKGQQMSQNIKLLPGDTVVVP